jgi:release factor glutamine methyltransferase
MQLKNWQFKAAKSLAKVSDTAFMDAQILLAYGLGKSKEWVVANQEINIPDNDLVKIQSFLEREKHGEPLPYILGAWEFYGLEFKVTPDVLIPRPETELLVDQASKWLSNHPAAYQVVDIGTGSGCISVALVRKNPHLQVIAIDISPEALAVACENAIRHGVSKRIQFIQSDLFTNVVGRFDLLCANLPYIPSGLLSKLPVSTTEPILALDGGKTGLTIISKFLAQAVDHLNSPGCVLCEIEAGEGKEILLLAEKYFPGEKWIVYPDLAGHPRLLVIEKV